MSYTLGEIKVAAYNWTEPPGMTQEERTLWIELGYCYECYRVYSESGDGEQVRVAKELAEHYIESYLQRKGQK